MSELILTKGKMPLLKPRSLVKSQLVFHIPDSVINRLSSIPEASENECRKKTLSTPIVLELSPAVETIEVVAEITPEKREQEAAASTESVIETYESPVHKGEVAEEKTVNETIPFYEMKMLNPEAVYKIGKSYLTDIKSGHKHFGFTTFTKKLNEAHMVVYASFIQYSLRKPVLVVLNDLNHKSLNRFKKDMSEGTLLDWKTLDWGEVCFIDQQEIINQSGNLDRKDLQFVSEQFCAVLWSLPAGNTNSNFQKAFMAILRKLDSVTFVVGRKESKTKEIQSAAEYYSCYNIKLKGVLFEEKEV